MLTKTQKISFVEENKKLLESYKVIGIVQLKGIPDRLLQSTKNKLKTNTRFIMGRKTLLHKILDGNESTKKLAAHLTDTSAIIVSNEDPFELYGRFKAGGIRLAAKPGQISPEDVHIFAGETGVAPGQTVTELKSAGIDVQIQKGKVVIAMDKVLVKKGDTINTSVAKALHTLDILPFKAVIEPYALISDSILFDRKALGINADSTTNNIILCFRNALALSMEANIISAYTITALIERAYTSAISLGIEAKVLDSGIVDLLVANAASQAAALNAAAGSGSKES